MDTVSKKEDNNNKIRPKALFFYLWLFNTWYNSTEVKPKKYNIYRNGEKMEKTKSVIRENLIYIIILIVIILVKSFIVSPIRVNGASMNDTLFDKDLMLLDKVSYKFNEIERFDIVVVDSMDQYIIKRVIGLPGDVIEYKDNILYVNGKELKEDFSHKKTNDFKVTIPENEYFVLGDNRNIYTDSRNSEIGTIKNEDIIGKIIFKLWDENK